MRWTKDRLPKALARRAFLATLCVAAGALCLGVLSANTAHSRSDAPAAALRSSSPASPSPSSSSSPGTSETLSTVVLGDVTVHSGAVTHVRYRADDSAGGAVAIDLFVTTAAGEIRRRLATGRIAEAGVVQVWRGRLRLRRGRYVLVARAVDASGRREATATPADLRVLAPLPPLVPTASARRAAFAWAARRAGRVAVAVVDSRGRVYGYHPSRRFTTASVVKAMLLVAYLRRHETLSDAARAALRRMITVSDNPSADAIYRDVGRRALVRLARRAGMRTFTASSAWILCRCGAADMARFFRDMERYIPRRHRRFANDLLTHVVSYQSWGIPQAARPLGYRVYFKPGWLGAWTLADQAARLERGRVRIGLAVFTDQNPTSSYGKETVAGVTARLLRR